jgi:hypothetical protein
LNAAKTTILLLWFVLVASLGNVSALTPGATENRTWEKSLATGETRQAGPLQTAGGHQENGKAGYDFVSASLLAAETTAADAPYAGQTLYRVYGGDSAAGGASWSPVNPGSVANYRDVAGLPSGGASGFNNTGRFVIEGTLQDPASVVNVRSALPLDGNSGGILEYVIPNWQKTGAIQVNRVSGVNPQF